MDETRNFLATLFGSMPEGGKLLVWTLENKRSHWCSSTEEAVAASNDVREDCNVYFGISLAGKDYGPRRRCPSSETIAIPGVWLDLDIAGSGHKKPNLPPNRDAVLELLREAGLPPTVSVNSGHGLQCFWLFHDLWEFASEDDRLAAETLTRRWNYTIKALAAKKGWDVDSTWDLARVFRLPGTTNRKVKDEPVPVYIIEIEESRRYTREQIEAKLDKDDPSRGKSTLEYSSVVVADDLKLDPGATFDYDLYNMLCEAEPRFQASFEHKRKDMTDQSASSYDLALANIAVQAGLSDQEIVNLLISHRRKHKEDLKLRIGYYRNTLLAARKLYAKAEAVDRLSDLMSADPAEFHKPEHEPDEEEHEPDGQDHSDNSEERQIVKSLNPAVDASEAKALAAKRAAILEHVSDILGFKITRIIKYISSEPTYRLETDRGGIMLGSVSGLINQEQMRTQVAALTSFYVPKMKQTLWDKVAQSLLNAVEEQSAGAEATDEGAIESWIKIYLTDNQPSGAGLNEENAASQYPYYDMDTGRIYLFGSGFKLWLRNKYGEAIPAKKMGAMLRVHGATDQVVGVKIKGKQTTRNVWRLPKSDNDCM